MVTSSNETHLLDRPIEYHVRPTKETKILLWSIIASTAVVILLAIGLTVIQVNVNQHKDRLNQLLDEIETDPYKDKHNIQLTLYESIGLLKYNNRCDIIASNYADHKRRSQTLDEKFLRQPIANTVDTEPQPTSNDNNSEVQHENSAKSNDEQSNDRKVTDGNTNLNAKLDDSNVGNKVQNDQNASMSEVKSDKKDTSDSKEIDDLNEQTDESTNIKDENQESNDMNEQTDESTNLKDETQQSNSAKDENVESADLNDETIESTNLNDETLESTDTKDQNSNLNEKNTNINKTDSENNNIPNTSAYDANPAKSNESLTTYETTIGEAPVLKSDADENEPPMQSIEEVSEKLVNPGILNSKEKVNVGQ